jgi:hypothetical protein
MKFLTTKDTKDFTKGHKLFPALSSPAKDPHWQLKWEDEFNTFNTNIWVK